MGCGRGERCLGQGSQAWLAFEGRPSWGGNFNRPQLNHCRKLLTAPYSLSRTTLLLGSQAVMQKESGLGPLTTHPRPQGQPAPNSSQPPKRLLVCKSKAGHPALIWPFPASPASVPLLRAVRPSLLQFPDLGAARPTSGILGACPCPSLPGSRSGGMAEAFTAPAAGLRVWKSWPRLLRLFLMPSRPL